ncbi:MAG: TatD family hydrolase [Pyrinomonadaceae bacterium]
MQHFVDSHAHIGGEEFDADRAEIVARARDAGVRAILNVCSGAPASGAFERAIETAEKYADVYAAIGVHPHDASLFNESVADQIRGLVNQSSRVVAFGEIGLDYHYDHSPREVQREAFAKQLRLARELSLPVVIHSRAADADTLEILREELPGSARSGVMHCFGGSVQMAAEALELGMMISFAGNVTFKNAESLREAARIVPLERLLIETDCPFLTPVPFRGRRNEPARVVEVARQLAYLKDLPIEEIGRITSNNFAHVFSLKGDG